RLHRELVARRQRGEELLERGGLGERRRASAQVHRFERRREDVSFELELTEQREDIARMLAVPADGRHEVAVAAPRRTEGQVDVEVSDAGCGRAVHFREPSLRFSTARNASCGTSTAP